MSPAQPNDKKSLRQSKRERALRDNLRKRKDRKKSAAAQPPTQK